MPKLENGIQVRLSSALLYREGGVYLTPAGTLRREDYCFLRIWRP